MMVERELDLEWLVSLISPTRGVVALTLGGSRASGLERVDSDWDFCIYYRSELDTSAIRALGFPGTVYEPGDWGHLLNGGAWLRIDDQQVDLLFRDLDVVERCIAEAEDGRFQIEEAQGYIAGLPSYFLVGEVTLGKLLVGKLPHADFPEALRRSAAVRWREVADFSLQEAEYCARRAEPATCAGMLSKAAIAVAHARLAERGEWAFNEKAILARANLADAGSVFATGVGGSRDELRETVASIRSLLGR